MNYPTEITDEVLDGNAHVSDDHILQDIEAILMEIEGHRLLAAPRPKTPPSVQNVMAEFYQNAKGERLKKMQSFIRFLKRLLEAREEARRCAETANLNARP